MIFTSKCRYQQVLQQYVYLIFFCLYSVAGPRPVNMTLKVFKISSGTIFDRDFAAVFLENYFEILK